MRGDIMFNTDKPIEKIEEDLLNRATFSKELASAILAYTNTENFAISLCGEWGCGKTSILHMVEQEITKKAYEMLEDERPIIINFNPWNYSDKNQLISQFFKKVCQTLNKSSNSKKLNYVGNAIEKYSSVIDYTKYIPVAGEYIALLKPLLKGIGKGFVEKAKKIDSIENQKNLVITALKELKQKIIVIIDDIDRLNNEQIRLIFQLVNSVAGFPNMIYLLSFDRSVVARALSEEQKCNGEEYLEKIIQVPFDVPIAKKEHINKILFSYLNEIVADITKDMFDQEHWEYVFRNCISEFIHSIRDVNRIINSYKLKYSLMHSETNWVDLLCITTLQISAPEIYNWIKDNIDSLAGSYYKGISGVQQKENKDEYISTFKTIYPKNPELMLTIIQTLFPQFCWHTGGYSKTEEEHKLRYLQRIASPQHSKLYFHLSLDDIDVSRTEVLKTVNNYNQDQLNLYLESLKLSDSLRSYLLELNCCIDIIPEDRPEMFFDEIIKLQLDSGIEKRKSVFEPSIPFDCHRCIWSILKRMDEELIVKVIKNFIHNSTTSEFIILLQYIVRIEQSYARIGNDFDYSYQVVPEESLNTLEEECFTKIKSMQDDDTLLDNNKFSILKMMWQYLSQEHFDEYMIRCLKDEKNVSKFLYLWTNTWQSGSNSGWKFEEERIKKYMTVEYAYNSIQELKRTDIFNNLTDGQKQVAVAFSIWYELDDKQSYKEVSLENVNKILSEWTKQ